MNIGFVFCKSRTAISKSAKFWYNHQFTDRSSHQRCSVKKGVLRNFAKFTGRHLCQSLFFIKVAGLRPATLLKKRLWRRNFPVSFAKFLRTPLFIEHLLGFLLKQNDWSGDLFWKRYPEKISKYQGKHVQWSSIFSEFLI